MKFKDLLESNENDFKVGDIVYHTYSYSGANSYGKGKIIDIKDNKVYVYFESVKGKRIFPMSAAKEVLKRDLDPV